MNSTQFEIQKLVGNLISKIAYEIYNLSISPN